MNAPAPDAPRASRSRYLRPMRRPIAVAEAALAQRTVTLAPEPPGEREGVLTPEGAAGAVGTQMERPAGPALTLVGVGDSLVAGSGVEHQDYSLVPRIARVVAARTGRDVVWSTRARLGSTMRRVRYRFLPEVSRADVLFVCAGSNDLLARRSVREWSEDLGAVLDAATQRASNVVVCSSGQLYRSPALRPVLRSVLRDLTDAQTQASAQICAERGVPFVDVAHTTLVDEFWASDSFHPSGTGYQMAADMIGAVVLDALASAPEAASAPSSRHDTRKAG